MGSRRGREGARGGHQALTFAERGITLLSTPGGGQPGVTSEAATGRTPFPGVHVEEYQLSARIIRAWRVVSILLAAICPTVTHAQGALRDSVVAATSATGG